MGYISRLLKEHDDAVHYFKKMMQLAWHEKDIQSEMLAYDNLSLDYFYLGELTKSNYYHDRMMTGKFENDKSTVKKVAINLLLSNRD